MAGLKGRSARASRTPQVVSVDDLTGGVDLRRSQTLMAPNRARNLMNFSLAEPGALTARLGFQRASSASLGAGRAQGGARIYLANSVFSLLAWGGSIYNPTDAWVFGSPVYSTLSATNQIHFPYDRDLVAAMDGANRPRFSTNGSSWMSMGINQPSTGPTLSSVNVSTAGLTTGEYAVAFSYKHRGTAHEGNVSAESTLTLTASSANAISGTIPASTDPKVDAAVYYARHKLPDAESVLRKVSSGAVGSSFTITSSNWTSNDEAPTNHDVPPTGLRFATPWKSRWWAPSGTFGNRLHFTELFQPQSWPSLYFIDIPFEKGDSITAVQPLGDTLLVHGQSGIFLVIGQTALDFEVRPSQGADAGAFGPRAVARIEQSASHVNADGVDSFDGAGDRALEPDIAEAWRDLVQNSAGADLERIACVYDALHQEFRISVPRVYPTGARGEWVLNLDRTRENEGGPAWTPTDRDIVCYIHWNGNEPSAGNRGRLFTLPSGVGIVYEENVAAGGNSSNVTSQYEGPGLSFGLHRSRVLGTWIEYQPQSGLCNIELVIDGISQGAFAVDISGGVVTYGSTVTYGTASRTYGGASRKKTPFIPQPLAAEGHTVVTKLTYIGQQSFKVFRYAHLVQPEPAPRMM